MSCAPGAGSPGGGEAEEARPATDQILSLQSNFVVSGRGQLTIQYTVVPPATSISAFHVEVETPVAGAADKGSAQTFAQNLPAGSNQAVTLDYAELPFGAYQIGLTVARPSGTTRVRSTGYLIVEAPPDPVFLAPLENLEVHQGDRVNIAFDNRKHPAARVRWRLFYALYDVRDTDHDGVINTLDQCPQTTEDERPQVDALGCGPEQRAGGDDFDGDGVINAADQCPATSEGAEVDPAGCAPTQLGTQLAVGDGNENEFVWDTTGAPRGNYRIGLSAADTGQAIESVWTAHPDRIVTRFTAAIVSIDAPAPPPTPPTLVFTRPIKDIGTFLTETVTLEYEVTLRTAGATGSVDIFLDPDTTPRSGNEIMILDDAAVTIRTASFSTQNIPEALYNVGGTIDDSANPPVTVYAPGRIDVVKTPALTVSEPNSPLPVRPGAEVNVTWTTNVPVHAGTLDVFAQRVGPQGEVEGPEMVIRPPGPPLSGSDQDTFIPTETGVFRVFVRVEFENPAVDKKVKSAPDDVRVTTLPPTLWLGLFAATEGRVDGAIVEGVNFEDNLGTNIAAVPDLNGDQVGEILVSSRYGKPGFKNSSGVGEGEAYLIYGSPNRLHGAFNANRLGQDKVGITFAGIRTREEPINREQTQGLSSIAVIPDLDFDDLPELVFGFSRTRSRGHNIDPLQDGLTDDRVLRSLERANQFLRGGIVIVSSKNSNLLDPTDRGLSPIIRLDLVGQQFEIMPPPFSGLEDVAFADYRSPSPCVFEMEEPCLCPEECPDGQECPPGEFEETACMDYCGVPYTCSDLCQLAGSGCEDPIPGTDCNECSEWDEVPCDRNPLICDVCWGDCECPQPDGLYDAMTPQGASTGFVSPLADSWFTRYFNCDQGWDCDNACVLSGCHVPPVCDFIYDPFSCPDPLHEGDICRYGGCFPYKPVFSDVGLPGQTGFYPNWIVPGIDPNDPIEPFGCRIIGITTYGGLNDGDHFGASLSVGASGGAGPTELLVSAPDRRQAIPTLALDDFGRCRERTWDGEVNNMLDTNGDGCPDPIDYPGIAYMINFELEGRSGERRPYNLWERDFMGRFPPKPHQYVAGTPSHCDAIEIRIDNPSSLRLIGQPNERFRNVMGIGDFNDDGRNDIMIGVPEANGKKGHLYVAYRREKRLEGDYVLGKLALPPNDSNRLDGSFVVWNAEDLALFGASLATDVDFNHDGLPDLVIGAPGARALTDQEGQYASDVGSVVIIFSNPTLVTPQGGVSVAELLRTGRAVRIDGNYLDEGGSFGFNVAGAGDVDDDGYVDLLIAAPGATPRFDPDPTDAHDALDEAGLDLDLDGQRDDIARRYNLAGFDNAMTRAGVVYVISGANKLSALPGGQISVRKLGTDDLRGLIVAGRRAMDFLGGGDAGDASMGGNDVKATRGRSFGLAAAGDLDGDGRADLAIGSVLADPRRDKITGEGVRNGGETYIVYGGVLPRM